MPWAWMSSSSGHRCLHVGQVFSRLWQQSQGAPTRCQHPAKPRAQAALPSTWVGEGVGESCTRMKGQVRPPWGWVGEGGSSETAKGLSSPLTTPHPRSPPAQSRLHAHMRGQAQGCTLGRRLSAHQSSFSYTRIHTHTHTHTPARSPLLTDSISPASFPCTAGPLEPSAELVVCALKIACVRRDGWGVLLSFSCLCAGVWIMLGNDILLTQALLLPPMLFPHPVGALAWDWLSMFKASLGVPFKTLIHPLTLRKAVARKGKNHPVSPWGCSGCVEVRTCPHLTPWKEDQSTRCSGPWCLPLPGSGAASAQPLAEAAAQ